MKTVFVSYSQPDEKIGDSIVERLKQEGFIVWFAPENFRPGDSFAEIFDQIDCCDAFVVLLSQNAKKAPWVNKELDVAITRQLSARPLLLIPIYIEPMDVLRKVADLKPIDLQESQWDEGLQLLVARLQSQDKDDEPSKQSFEQFLNKLVQIDAARFTQILTLSNDARSKAPPTLNDASQAVQMAEIQAEIQARALHEIARLLDKAAISKEDCGRILDAAKRGLELPIVNRLHLRQLRRFARRADETVVKLADEMWQLENKQDITLEWLAGWLANYLRKHFSIEDEDLLSWEAESLVDEARAAGLFVRSTEMPRGGAKGDAERNPSYNLGPMVQIAGRLVSAFTARHQELLG